MVQSAEHVEACVREQARVRERLEQRLHGNRPADAGNTHVGRALEPLVERCVDAREQLGIERTQHREERGEGRDYGQLFGRAVGVRRVRAWRCIPCGRWCILERRETALYGVWRRVLQRQRHGRARRLGPHAPLVERVGRDGGGVVICAQLCRIQEALLADDDAAEEREGAQAQRKGFLEGA